jgi:transcriptional regulator NrdR family protein
MQQNKGDAFLGSCERCGSTAHKCLDSRPMDDWRRRRYVCLGCGKRTTTYELSADDFAFYQLAAAAHLDVMHVAEKLRRLADELDGRKQIKRCA